MKTRIGSPNRLRSLALCGLLLCQMNVVFVPITVRAADGPGVVEQVKDATAAVQEATKDATREVGTRFEDVWRRVSESRLRNRTPDELVAWVITGVLVGAVAGTLTSLRTSGLGKLGRLLLGLTGAFFGGMIVHVGRIDFGMGPVLIRYEELLFSLAGAVVLILAVRLIGSRARKKEAKR